MSRTDKEKVRPKVEKLAWAMSVCERPPKHRDKVRPEVEKLAWAMPAATRTNNSEFRKYLMNPKGSEVRATVSRGAPYFHQ